MSDQPWYVNAVASVATMLDPVALLAVLNNTEAELGRVRTARDEPRLIDLDLLAYGPIVAESGPPPILPHPRMAGRAFVLLPIRDLDPNWRHPKTGKSINELIAEIPPNQITRRLEART
jgi:2-amino-4-hydroxy-6-hydroxymethyldihydropteridine diphosphokinase